MADDDRDMRKLLLAFEDASTWCTQLGALASRLIRAVKNGERLPANDLEDAERQVRETQRHLEADRTEVARIRKRTGLR